MHGDVLLPCSIVSDDKPSHISPRRISSLIPLLIFSKRLLHFVVFGISTLESYNQRFFQSEIDIFLNVCLNPLCLPGYNVARLPGCSLNIQWMCRLFERGKCQKKSTKGVIFYNQRKSFLFQTKKTWSSMCDNSQRRLPSKRATLWAWAASFSHRGFEFHGSCLSCSRSIILKNIMINSIYGKWAFDIFSSWEFPVKSKIY